MNGASYLNAYKFHGLNCVFNIISHFLEAIVFKFGSLSYCVMLPKFKTLQVILLQSYNWSSRVN